MSEQYEWTLTVEPGMKYNPDQPRVPEGQTGGGRWTSGDSMGETSTRLADNYRPPKTITDLKGNRIPPPRDFYRGYNPESTQRIRTGESEWDSYLFVTDAESHARNYGKTIVRIRAKPEAKILYEGTRDYSALAKGTNKLSNFERYQRVAERARREGFDAVWYKRQGDTGTAIMNREMFIVED